MATWQTGEKNGNWKGGRTLSSHGYVLIRVGVNHHLADVRGYAYEHRVVAEKKLGRRLIKGEIIHHKDGDKTNNDPSNIEICSSIALHKVKHRHKKIKNRIPGELNPTIECACGCGKVFTKYDGSGRPRKFVVGGHSWRGKSRSNR